MNVEAGLWRVGQEAARRLQKNGLRAKGRVRLDAITPEEIASLSGLFGSRWRAPSAGRSATVDLAALDGALRTSGYACTLLDLATALHGSALVDVGATRSVAAAARDAGWAALREHPAVTREPALSDWLERERSTGAALRAIRAHAPTQDADPFALLHAVLGLAATLPCDAPMSLAGFATQHCGGDPHALDRDRPLDATLRRALAHLDGDLAPPTGAVARRERYDRWGLACDELSGTVLAFGLAPAGSSVLERSLRLAAEAGEPRVLTLRELRGTATLACGPRLFMCENPDVIAAAVDALGPACLPLICTEGWPSTACLRLLRALVAGGATAHHHGDMDPDGLRIVDHLLAATGGKAVADGRRRPRGARGGRRAHRSGCSGRAPRSPAAGARRRDLGERAPGSRGAGDRSAARGPPAPAPRGPVTVRPVPRPSRDGPAADPRRSRLAW